MTATLRIELFPGDIECSLAFYERMGFTTSGPDQASPRYGTARLGDVRIGLAEATPIDPAMRAYPMMTEIVIEVDDIHGFHKALVEAGIELREELRERPWGLIDVRVVDPDGYYLRFTDRRS